MGKIHTYSQKFQFHLGERRHWFDNQYLQEFSQHIPKDFQDVFQARDALVSEINDFKKTNENFGLIHGDIHPANFLLNQQSLTIIDFDESQFSFFAEDIGIALYYSVYVLVNQQSAERDRIAKEFTTHFFKGYQTQREIGEDEVAMLSSFIRLRELIAFVGAYKKWDFDNLDDWQIAFLIEAKTRIVQGKSIVSLDFSSYL